MIIDDTIAAVSTPPGKGGVAMIRISGRDAAAVADRVFRPRTGDGQAPLSSLTPRRAVWGDILSVEPDGSAVVIDDGVAIYYRAPHSYTGEDTVELCCHGGVLMTQTVLESVLCAGARMAGPGEFTRRAFVSGRMGLSEAEALASLLDAQTYGQLKLSRAGMGGRLGREVDELYVTLRTLVSDIYARVDFPDEDLSGLTRGQLREGVAGVGARCRALLATYRTGHAVGEGIRTVLCGAVNSGKSSLYNALLGREAAIVTDVAGTTRDVLEDTVSVGGVTLRLCDTAGLRGEAAVTDAVERIGIDRTRERIASAELVVALFDGSREGGAEDAELSRLLEGSISPVIKLVTKSDLPRAAGAFVPEGAICISTRTGAGLDDFAARVRGLFIDGSLNMSEDAIVANARQYAALRGAEESVGASLAALDAGLPEDVACSDLESAMSALAEVDGRAVTVDIVNDIFARFCVGK